MPTVNEVLGNALQKAIQNPKSTTKGCLMVVLFVLTGLSMWAGLPPKYGASIGSLVLLVHFYLNAITIDAGKTPAYVPGQSQPEMVASREVPMDPAAVPATPNNKPL